MQGWFFAGGHYGNVELPASFGQEIAQVRMFEMVQHQIGAQRIGL